jgi:hypothetical protein
MVNEFLEIVLTRRRRGRPSRRRWVDLRLADGTRLRIGDGVDGALVRGVLRQVLQRRPC